LLRQLIDIQYERNDYELSRGKFRVRGDVVECWPAYEEFAYRIELWGDQIERLSIIEPVTGEEARRLAGRLYLPGKALRVATIRIDSAIDEIKRELDERLEFFRREGNSSKPNG